MIELQIGKKKIELPDKLTIQQYHKLKLVKNLEKNPIEFLSAICNLQDTEIRYAKKKDMDFVLNYLSTQYLQTQDYKLQTRFNFKGVEYGLMTDITTLNFGGWVDLEYLTTDGVEKNMHLILAIMYRPIIKNTKKGYEIKEYDHDEMLKTGEEFLELPVEYFWGVFDFFTNLVKAYTEIMRGSLEFQKTKRKALTRLKIMNPLRHLYKMYQGFTGRV